MPMDFPSKHQLQLGASPFKAGVEASKPPCPDPVGWGLLWRADSSWRFRWGKPTTLPAAEVLVIAGKKLNADLNAAVNIVQRAAMKL